MDTVIQSLQMTSSMPGAQNLTLIYGLTLGEIAIALPGTAGADTDSGLVSLSSYVQCGFSLPFPISVNVSGLSH